VLRLLAAALAVFVALTLYLLVLVQSDDPKHADAIVVLSGDRKRLATGVRLFMQGVAPTLVISRDGRPWREADALCAGANIICFQANPYSTEGEAQEVGRLERKQGWRRIVIVTSRYHLRRARMLFDRCTGRRPQVVAAKTTVLNYLVDVPWEWGKLVYQLTVDRSC
jgi:uncharacterized SAM-binding protein YcdF (DUF218 family)